MSLPLEARGLSIAGRLRPTDVQLRPRTLTALIGPNGSGKTSLLRALAGIEASAGSVWVCGKELSSARPAMRRKLLSFLPASREMVWPIPARDVIALGLDGRDPGRIDELIAALELQALADRTSDRLSTGERARVLLGRALAPSPAVLLLDEPLSNLDPYWVLRTLALLKEAVESGPAALVSVHDLSLLHQFDEVILMADGGLALQGKPDGMLSQAPFEQVFRVRPAMTGWELSPQADPRSSR